MAIGAFVGLKNRAMPIAKVQACIEYANSSLCVAQIANLEIVNEYNLNHVHTFA